MLFGKLFTNPKMWMNGDADEIKMSGVYTCKDVQNVPTGDGALFVFKTEDTMKQVFVPVGEDGVVYTRVLGEEWGRVTGTSEETGALIQSAINKANQAQAKADLVDTKLDNIIVESGTSDAEVVAARTDSNGQTFTTLGQRLDTQFNGLNSKLSGAKLLALGTDVIQLSANTDLNTITTPGNYRAVTVNIAQTIVNSPSKRRFRLSVTAITTTSYIIQEFLTYDGDRYTRTYESGSDRWSGWYADNIYIVAPKSTDVSAEISASLNRYGLAILRVGSYTVHNITVPANGAIIGCGKGTIIKLNSEYPTDNAFIATSGNVFTSMKIVGSGDENYQSDGNITASNGIYITGEGTDANRKRLSISNLEVCGFTGAGICSENTGYNYDDSVNVIDCYLHNNNVGIKLGIHAEYTRISCIECSKNYYGCINNGGNNIFNTCGFNGNTQGILMDNSDNTASNNSHGSFIGCTVNHSGNNAGKALEIINMTSGEMFVGCQFFYGTTHITNSSGIVFASCNYGNDSGITVNGGGGVIMNGCMHINRANTPITITNNTGFHAVNCYNREGTLYTDYT